MPSELDFVTTLLAAMAAVFAFLTYFQHRRGDAKGKPLVELMTLLLRNESDRTRQAGDEQARAARQEMAEGLRAFQDATLRVFRELRDLQGAEVKTFGDRLEAGMRTMDERATNINNRLAEDSAKRSQEAAGHAQNLRDTLIERSEEAERKRALAARDSRDELHSTLQGLGGTLSHTFVQIGEQQKERLENVTLAVSSLSGKQVAGAEALRAAVEERLDRIRTENGVQLEEMRSAVSSLSGKQAAGLEALRGAVEERLDRIRTENAGQLDEMRKSVDEKLQSTLEQRLGESFSRMVKQLEVVHQGIGEMHSLAAGVGDLKRVLTNVRVRGTYGEVQAAVLLEQFLSPEQFVRNAQIRDNSQERVEFAVRLPGRDVDGEVLLPIDARFPRDEYERLVASAEVGNPDAVADAAKELEDRVRFYARAMRDKYVAPPRTTDFAILFLPSEGIYAEVLRRPGFFEQLQRDYHVTLTGPATLTAFLNALQMGFRSIAIEKRSIEVWHILGAVRNEFSTYNDVVDKLASQLTTALKSVEKLGTRTRAMDRQLRTVEKLPDTTTELLLGVAIADSEDLRAGELALAERE